MSITVNGIILEGTLRKCKKHKIFKTKWVERYFVLYRRDGTRNSYSLDEYKSYRKRDLKKTFHLELVNRVESNLSVNDPSLSCSTRPDSLNSILSIGFVTREIQKDIYLAAQNHELMNKWVRELCRVCGLSKEQDVYQDRLDIEPSQFASSSAIGMSDSSDSLDASLGDQHSLPDANQISHNSGHSLYYENGTTENRMVSVIFGNSRHPDGRRKYLSIRQKPKNEVVSPPAVFSSVPNTQYDKPTNMFVQNDIYLLRPNGAAVDKSYIRLQNCTSINSSRSLPRDSNYSNLMAESCSETSSMYSSRKNVTTTEDDTASCTSGPPVPPPRSRYQNKFTKNGTMQKLNTAIASTSIGAVTNENDSSGETLKMEPNTESIDSSEGFGGSPKKSGRRAPPPIDRSNKPKNLRLEDKHYRNVSRSSSMDNKSGATHHYTSYSRTLTTDVSSKRKNLDYFEPSTEIVTVPIQKPPSTRSPTPSDIEYITVDVDRTLAFKQMRRAAPASMD